MNVGMSIDDFSGNEEVTVWDGTFFDLPCRIVRWTDGPGARLIWNYYVTVPMEQVPEDMFTDMVAAIVGERDADEVAAKYFGGCKFHGGITFARATSVKDASGVCETDKGLKVGCDFNHISDSPEDYGFYSVRDKLIVTAGLVRQRLNATLDN